jgi:hypothetical protein
MVSANQIREVVWAYFRDNDDRAFVLEFSKLAFGVGQHGDPDAIVLAKAIDGRLALVHAGHLSLSGLRAWLSENAFKEASSSSNAANVSMQNVSYAVAVAGTTTSNVNLPAYV